MSPWGELNFINVCDFNIHFNSLSNNTVYFMDLLRSYGFACQIFDKRKLVSTIFL